ncbi:unnamed protein product [Phyllotreta striolata]|uniref:Uncharacterized protein n=1 Tax=Phyllotreta striolata TaxID=444603 RepID=A0A9N9TEZ6_PHYSR|nr:unnamed protein product [Phyllotreta striolata]
MHFWIDKRSQRCGFNTRQIPPSFSGYGRSQRSLCGSFYPKPMVTPVHRFQSIEGGLRANGRSGYNGRLPQLSPIPSTSVHYNNADGHRSRSAAGPGEAPESDPARPNNPSPTYRLKCGVWIFFALIMFFLAGAKYYFHGVSTSNSIYRLTLIRIVQINIGVEVLVFVSLLVVALMLGGLISLCEAVASFTPPANRSDTPIMRIIEEQEQEEGERRNSTVNVNNNAPTEMPPPPYHIAVMLCPRGGNDLNTVHIIRDSPPPTYEKAVT